MFVQSFEGWLCLICLEKNPSSCHHKATKGKWTPYEPVTVYLDRTCVMLVQIYLLGRPTSSAKHCLPATFLPLNLLIPEREQVLISERWSHLSYSSALFQTPTAAKNAFFSSSKTSECLRKANKMSYKMFWEGKKYSSSYISWIFLGLYLPLNGKQNLK